MTRTMKKMPKTPLWAQAVALFTVVAFSVVSCTPYPAIEGERIDREPADNFATVEVGKGTPRYSYLDANNQPTDTDTGRTLIYVEDNEQAKNVAVVAELPNTDPNNAPGNDYVISILNSENDSRVAFYYHNGKRFPYKVVIIQNNKTIVGSFSFYSQANQTYSVVFNGGSGAITSFDNFMLNRSVLDCYQDDAGKSRSWNDRMRLTVISLGVSTSLAMQIPDIGFNVKARGAAWWEIGLAIVFGAVALVAFAVVLVVALPASIAVTALTTLPVIAKVAIGIGAAAIGIGAVAGILDIVDSWPTIEEATPSTPPPAIKVYYQGAVLPNNGPVIYIAPSATLDFDIYGFGDVGNMSPPEKFCPHRLTWGETANGGGVSYQTAIMDDHTRCSITRDSLPNEGAVDGRFQYILDFEKNLVINDSDAGVFFNGETRKDIFIVNLTIRTP